MPDLTDLARWALVAVFVLTWLGISARRVQLLPIGRPAMALVGAVTLVVLGQLAGPWGLTVDEALRVVEPHTIALLLGMMVVAAGLAEAGFFASATSLLARTVSSPAQLLWVVTVGAGLLSAVLVNDAICLLATPLVVALVHARGLPTRPFLFAVAMGSNAGSALTLAGNPQNMLVAKLSGLAYRDYLAHVAIPATGALLITAALLHVVFRKDLVLGAPSTPVVQQPRDVVLVRVALLVLAAVVVANLAGASLALSALAGAAVVLVAARHRAEALLAQVDWSVLLFFSGLFVVVAALQRTGLPASWLATITPAADAPTSHAGVGVLSVVLLLGSQVVSNVPLILLLEPWIRGFPDAPFVWTVTALVSTLAGNLTLLGSVANIIVVERARERLGFFEYLKVGLLVTTASTAFALTSLWLLW